MYIYKGKDKAATGMFLDLLYKKYISNNDAVQKKIIWSDRSTSKFKVIIFFEVLKLFSPSVAIICKPVH